ncbi:MAG: hypothetical protein JWN38_962 [Candidatus Saccharibacteria bacterium]|nr:hypothetical protein [Candidatus Saccharibacteria bacterium]
MENPTDKQWLEESYDQFVVANTLAANIHAQNKAHEDLIEAGQVTIAPFQEVVVEHLTNEQTTTFQALAEAEEAAPYAELAAREAEVRHTISQLVARIDGLSSISSEEATRIQAEQAMLVARLPELSKQLDEVSKVLQDKLVEKERANLEVEKATLEAQYIAINGLYEVAGKPWAVPQLLTLTIESIELEADEPSSVVVVDDFSDIGRPQTSSRDIAEAVRRKQPESRLSDASEFIAEILAEEPGHIFTVLELGDILYADTTPSAKTRSARAAALISNFETQKISVIGRVLAGYGLVYQRGVRTTYDVANGEKVGPSTRVMRAVPFARAAEQIPVAFTEDDTRKVHGSWSTIIYTTEPRAATPRRPIIAAPADTMPALGAPIVAEPKPPVPTPAQVFAAAAARRAAVEAAAKEIATVEVVPAAEPLGQLELEEIAAETTPEQQATVEPVDSRNPEWLPEFDAAIRRTILELEELGILDKPTISRRLYSIKSNSTSQGSNEMVRRGVTYRILNRNESDLDLELPVYKFVALALQNPYKPIFENPTKRKVALGLIEKLVQATLDDSYDS